jgi:hypothetical protein
MHDKLSKIIYEMVATMNSPSKTGSGIYVLTQTFSVKVYLRRSQDRVQGATTGGASVLGHTYGSSTSPPRPWSSGAAEEGIHRTLQHHF